MLKYQSFNVKFLFLIKTIESKDFADLLPAMMNDKRNSRNSRRDLVRSVSKNAFLSCSLASVSFNLWISFLYIINFFKLKRFFRADDLFRLLLSSNVFMFECLSEKFISVSLSILFNTSHIRWKHCAFDVIC